MLRGTQTFEAGKLHASLMLPTISKAPITPSQGGQT